ncbi:Glycosyl hydrolases 36 [Sesbania bispinosa]|nr:Glycosyl hydrolases 36 [Sesbania bispinosa]
MTASVVQEYMVSADDGWQQIESKPKDVDSLVQEGAQFANRLTGIKENTKFQRMDRTTIQPQGGVKPAASGMEHYDTSLAYPVHSPGVLGNQPDIVMDCQVLTNHDSEQ